jgi:hypothetical protein
VESKSKKSIATSFSLWNQNQLPLALACGIKIKKNQLLQNQLLQNQLPLALASGIKIKKSIATGFSLWNQNQKNQLPLALACGIKIKKINCHCRRLAPVSAS